MAYDGSDIEYVDIRPNSKSQIEFYKNAPLNDETLFGGAAGPGKTSCIVALPIVHGFHNVSGFRQQIFRETRVQLDEWIIPYQKMIYPLAGGAFNEQKLTWTFPSGAVIKDCYMEHSGDWTRYASGNNTVQAFDECTEIHEDNFTVTTWNRSACAIKPFRVYGTNPGGRSHLYFKKRFVDMCPPVKDGNLRWCRPAAMWWQPMKAGEPVNVVIEYNGQKRYIKRQFIPARIFDNEDLLKNNPNYLSTLMSLAPDRRRKLLDGDWNLIVGQFLEMLREDIHFIKSKAHWPSEWRVLGSIDYGTQTAHGIIRTDKNNARYLTDELYMEGYDREDKANESAKFLRSRGMSGILNVGDSNMWYKEKEHSKLGSAADAYKKKGVKLIPVSKKKNDDKFYREYANEVMYDHLSYIKGSNGLFTKPPKLFICYDTCPKTAETLPLLQRDKHNPKDIDRESKIDHCYDMLKNGIVTLTQKNFDPKAAEEMQKRMNERKRSPRI